MKRILLAILALTITPFAIAQTATPTAPTAAQPCVSINIFSGQSAWQASYADAKNGATFPSAVWVVTGTRVGQKSATITVSIYANVAAAQNSCLQSVDQFGVQFTGAAFTAAFGAPLTVTSGETFAQAVNAEALAALKANSPVATQLASATNVTL